MVGLPLLTTTILPPLESPASLVGLEAASQERAEAAAAAVPRMTTGMVTGHGPLVAGIAQALPPRASQARAAVESPARAAVERQESLVAAAAAPAPAGTALGTDPPHGDTVDGTQVLPPQASPARAVEDQASPARAVVEDAASPARAAEDQVAAAAPAPAGTALDGTHPPHGDMVDGTQALRPPQASLARVAVEVASLARAVDHRVVLAAVHMMVGSVMDTKQLMAPHELCLHETSPTTTPTFSYKPHPMSSQYL